MAFKMTNTDRVITLYNFSVDTNEFIGDGDVFIPAYTGLPACCTDIVPSTAPAGSIAIFDNKVGHWSIVEDHRGEVFYDIHTGKNILIEQLGVLPVDIIPIAPDGDFLKWDGMAWVKDEEAEIVANIHEAEAKKLGLMQRANERIAPLQDAIDLGMATNEEEKLLGKWKKYRVQLMRVDTSAAPDIHWPDMV